MRKILIFLLCFCVLFGCFVISSFADEGVTPRAIPTDLTGYTVTVPANWVASSGYGQFSIDYEYNSGGSTVIGSSIFIGYRFSFDSEQVLPSANYIFIQDEMFEVYPGSSFTMNITGGVDVTNSSLIQWFVDNNATFEGGSTPEPEVYTVPSGYYKLASLPSQGVPSVGGFSPGIEHLFETPVQLIYSSGVVKQYTYFGFVVSEFTDSNNFSVDFTVQLLDISTPVRVANLTAVDGVCTSQFYGGISNVYFAESFSIDEFSQQLILFTFALDSSFIPDEPDVPEFSSNPWIYIFDMIIEALKTPLFGYFSIWDIYVTICSIFLVTWLLKLLAGG